MQIPVPLVNELSQETDGEPQKLKTLADGNSFDESPNGIRIISGFLWAWPARPLNLTKDFPNGLSGTIDQRPVAAATTINNGVVNPNCNSKCNFYFSGQRVSGRLETDRSA